MGKTITSVSEIAVINMAEHPTSISSHDPGTTITIGDLHGNAIKLIYILIREGVIALRNGETDYHELLLIYDKFPPGKYHEDTYINILTRDDLDTFKRILNHARLISSDIKINLIGDELADRGRNDFFMLLTLLELKERKIETDIFISNHAAEFIKAYANMENNHEPRNQLKKSIIQTEEGDEYHLEAVTFKNIGISGYEQTNSLQNLGFLMTAHLVTKNELIFMVKEAYAPNIKLLDYSFDQETGDFYIYSHNMIGLETIAKLAAEYDVEFWLDELLQFKTAHEAAEHLIPTLDKINNAFRASILHRCKDGRDDFNADVANVLDSKMIQRITWERNIPAHIMLGKIGPLTFKSVHGHQGPNFISNSQYNVNLDTHLGREDNPDGSYFGDYCIMSAPSFSRAISKLEEQTESPKGLAQHDGLEPMQKVTHNSRHRRHSHYFNLSEVASEQALPPLPLTPREAGKNKK